MQKIKKQKKQIEDQFPLIITYNIYLVIDKNYKSLLNM